MTVQEKMKAKLESLGLPFVNIDVYGSHIMVTTRGEATADKWHSILSKFTDSRRPVRTIEHNKVNMNTCLLPSSHEVWLIGGKINV